MLIGLFLFLRVKITTRLALLQMVMPFPEIYTIIQRLPPAPSVKNRLLPVH